jgi:TPR repeat protein
VPHSIETDDVYRIAFVALSGDIGLGDISALFQEIRERFTGQDYSALIDISAAELHGDMETVRAVANFERIFTRIAVYAPSAVLYGLARAYEALSQLYRERRVAVFRDREHALQWLMSAAAKNSL